MHYIAYVMEGRLHNSDTQFENHVEIIDGQAALALCCEVC
jgi:hypothetical protein